MVDGRTLLREIQPRQTIERETALGIRDNPYPSIYEDADFIKFTKGLDIRHNTPEQRFTELDQTDPVGRFRFRGSNGSFSLEKAATAAWATTTSLMIYDVTNTAWSFGAVQSEAWSLQLLAGVAAGNVARLELYASSAGTPRIDLRTGNNGGSTVTRMSVAGGAGSPDISITNAALNMGGNVLKGASRIRNVSNDTMYIFADAAATDAVAQRIALYVLDPATDTEYAVAQAVPKAATPLFTMAAPDFVATATELNISGSVTFGFTKATNTFILYANNAGVIKTLVLGVGV